ncbi:MAG: extracellular solute-binding protein [Candidatus Hadarchaeales archaeon]
MRGICDPQKGACAVKFFHRMGKTSGKGGAEKITLLHGWTGAELPPINAMIRSFERKHGIRVESQDMSWESLRVEIGSRIEYDPPDIFPREVGPELYELSNRELLADITDTWSESRFHDAFPDWITEMCIRRKKAIAVPVKLYTFAVWYLRRTFERYGVSPPETWDEFIELCRTLKRKGIYPVVASGWGNSIWINHILPGVAGAKFYQKLMDGEESWTDSRVIESYELLRDLTSSFFLPHPFAYDFDKEWEKLNRGEAAMMLQGDWVNGMWQNQFGYSPGRSYDFFLLPPPNPENRPTMVVGGNVWVAPALAGNLRGAKTFLGYAGSLDAHEILAREGMGILARKEVPESAYDTVLVRLRRELFSRRTVFGMQVFMPHRALAAEEKVRRETVINPRISSNEIKELLGNVGMASKSE